MATAQHNPTETFNREEWEHKAVDFPQQTNSIDCGVFVLAAIYYIVHEITTFDFKQRDMPGIRIALGTEIFFHIDHIVSMFFTYFILLFNIFYFFLFFAFLSLSFKIIEKK